MSEKELITVGSRIRSNIPPLWMSDLGTVSREYEGGIVIIWDNDSEYSFESDTARLYNRNQVTWLYQCSKEELLTHHHFKVRALANEQR